MDNYECHITVNKPETQERRELFNLMAKNFGWSTSEIDGDPILGDKPHFFFTRHNDSYVQLFREMEALAACLGTMVIRKKIEHIIYDVRF